MKLLNLKIALFLLTVIMFQPLEGMLFAEMTPAWVQGYNAPGNKSDFGNVVLHDAQNNIYVGGHSNQSVGNDWTVFLNKYNQSGTLVWSKTYTNASHGLIMINMFIDNSNNIYITGEQDNNLLLLKYNSSGILLWNATFPDMWGYDVFATSEGNVYVTGFRWGPPEKCVTVKFNSSGVLQWSDTRSVGSRAQGSKIRVDGNGNVYVQGVFGDSNLRFPWILKYNNNTGLIQGMVKIDDTDLIGCPWVVDMELDNAGNIYMTVEGYYSSYNSDILTFKMDPSLNVLWKKRFNGAVNKDDVPFDMHVDGATGIVYVTGKTWTSNLTKFDFITIKYLTNGVEQWHKVYNGSANDTDFANSIHVDAFGSVYVTGVTKSDVNEFDITTVKYTPLGVSTAWSSVFSASWYDRVSDIDLDNNGNVFVAGYTYRFLNDDFDMVLIKYASTVGIQQTSSEIPDQFELKQNYPNPFNPNTNISFSIPKSGNVKLVVFDASGRQVAELVNENLSAGKYNYDFNAGGLSSGVYFYKLTTNDFTEVKKMILVK